MPNFRVYATFKVELWREVEANSKEEAEAKVKDAWYSFFDPNNPVDVPEPFWLNHLGYDEGEYLKEQIWNEGYEPDLWDVESEDEYA